jgi:hypothetical protein
MHRYYPAFAAPHQARSDQRGVLMSDRRRKVAGAHAGILKAATALCRRF